MSMKKHGNNSNIIPTYIINVKERTDRLSHTKQQFSDKPEFNILIIEAVTHSVGSIGLWQSTLEIVKIAQQHNHEYILICEDDHQFTKSYTIKKLQRCISEAQKNNADILLGGVHWFNSVMKVTPDLFWVDKFTATHFVIIYRKFFNTILEADFGPTDNSDLKISDLTDNKLVIYPFISTQKEFGYSDITPSNNKKGHINSLFKATSTLIHNLDEVSKSYQAIPVTTFNNDDLDSNNVTIPTYIITSFEQTERLRSIKQQFKNKQGFDTIIVEACKHKSGPVGLWNSYRKIINLAIKNGDDVIIICEDDHEFTAAYSWEFLLRNILEAHQQGSDILYGGSGDFGLVVPITADRFWVNQLVSTQFIVVYRKFFARILKYPFKEDEVTDYALSKLTNDKMILCPSISVQKDFGYSNVTPINNELKKLVSNMLARKTKRMEKINEAYLRYNEPI